MLCCKPGNASGFSDEFIKMFKISFYYMIVMTDTLESSWPCCCFGLWNLWMTSNTHIWHLTIELSICKTIYASTAFSSRRLTHIWIQVLNWHEMALVLLTSNWKQKMEGLALWYNYTRQREWALLAMHYNEINHSMISLSDFSEMYWSVIVFFKRERLYFSLTSSPWG